MSLSTASQSQSYSLRQRTHSESDAVCCFSFSDTSPPLICDFLSDFLSTAAIWKLERSDLIVQSKDLMMDW